jgi:hypothetical protein
MPLARNRSQEQRRQRKRQRTGEQINKNKNDRHNVDAPQHVGERQTGRNGRKVNKHLHHGASQFAADDLARPQRGDREQLKRAVFALAGQRAERSIRHDDQQRKRQDHVIAIEHLRPVKAVVHARPEHGDAGDRPEPRAQKHESKRDHELLTLERLAAFLDQNRVEPFADALQAQIEARQPRRRSRRQRRR